MISAKDTARELLGLDKVNLVDYVSITVAIFNSSVCTFGRGTDIDPCVSLSIFVLVVLLFLYGSTVIFGCNHSVVIVRITSFICPSDLHLCVHSLSSLLSFQFQASCIYVTA